MFWLSLIIKGFMSDQVTAKSKSHLLLKNIYCQMLLQSGNFVTKNQQNNKWYIKILSLQRFLFVLTINWFTLFPNVTFKSRVETIPWKFYFQKILPESLNNTTLKDKQKKIIFYKNFLINLVKSDRLNCQLF